jgi:hypothetical protein
LTFSVFLRISFRNGCNVPSVFLTLMLYLHDFLPPFIGIVDCYQTSGDGITLVYISLRIHILTRLTHGSSTFVLCTWQWFYLFIFYYVTQKMSRKKPTQFLCGQGCDLFLLMSHNHTQKHILIKRWKVLYMTTKLIS